MYAFLESIKAIMLYSNRIIISISHPSSPSRGLDRKWGSLWIGFITRTRFWTSYRPMLWDSCNVRVMVSLNRQGHIVTECGKSRNITLRDYSASGPVLCHESTPCSGSSSTHKGEMKVAGLSLVSAPEGRLASST